MTWDEYILKYGTFIRSVLVKCCQPDEIDDRFQDVCMALGKYIDTLNGLENDRCRIAYIRVMTRRIAIPRKNTKKLSTYEDWSSGDDDATSPEEWLLEDDTHTYDAHAQLKKRAEVEPLLDLQEQITATQKTIKKLMQFCYGWYYARRITQRQWVLANYDNWHPKDLVYQRKYRENNREKIRAIGREFYHRNRDKKLEYARQYRLRKKLEKQKENTHE